MVNYYCRFIASYAEVFSPLHKMITPSKKGKSIKLTWTTEQKAAFENSKEALLKARILSHPLPSAQLRGPTQFFGTFFICGPIRTKFAQYM